MGKKKAEKLSTNPHTIISIKSFLKKKKRE